MPSDESKGSQLDAIGSLAQRQLDNTVRVRPTYRGAPVAESRRRTTTEPDQKPAAPDGSPLLPRVPTIIMMKDTQPIHRWVLPQSSVGGRRVTCSRARVLA